MVVQQPLLHMQWGLLIHYEHVDPLCTFATKGHAWNKLHSVAITNAAESILGEGVARPAGASIRAHSVDTLIFAEMGIF